MNNYYKNKYLKYKNKYLNLQNKMLHGGAAFEQPSTCIRIFIYFYRNTNIEFVVLISYNKKFYIVKKSGDIEIMNMNIDTDNIYEYLKSKDNRTNIYNIVHGTDTATPGFFHFSDILLKDDISIKDIKINILNKINILIAAINRYVLEKLENPRFIEFISKIETDSLQSSEEGKTSIDASYEISNKKINEWISTKIEFFIKNSFIKNFLEDRTITQLTNENYDEIKTYFEF